MSSLRARMSAVYLTLLLGLGTLLVFVLLRGANLYFEEVHHKLNADVAAHIAESVQPFAGDELDRDALKKLFMDVMTINASLEVYLLDREGNILAYDAPPEHVRRRRVDLAPIRELLAANDRGEDAWVRGDDPRSEDGHKLFSVARVVQDGEHRGYVYVILGGERFTAVAATLGESRMLRCIIAITVTSVLLSALLGTVGIGLLNRPLRQLGAAMARFRDGDEDVRVDVSALKHDRGEIGTLARTFDAMAERIRGQVERLQRNDQRRREFVANVSHDLRTPTAAIQGYLETLVLRADRISAEERAEFLGIALRQTERLAKLVDQLFELTRLEAREFEPEKEAFVLAELVQDVVAKFQGPARGKDIELTARLAYDLPPVHADIGLIERALDNLIDNAIRYTRPGGRVEVALSQVAGGVGVSVADTGPGIPSDELPRVFDRFYRVERELGSDLEAVRGTGLGLAITKRIVDMHQGSIEIESREEQGTRFSFVLATA